MPAARPADQPGSLAPTDRSGAPLEDVFAAAMAAVGPWENRPVLACGVSGGADSLTLALLADAWARARGGHAIGLTVDHGLRPEASAEAAETGAWLAEADIPHHVLTWTGPHPATGIQAAARAARYRLLEDWCAAEGVLHLALGHHADDQVETVRLRAGRGSGPRGLAAMAAVSWRAQVRLLRPLLGVPKTALLDWLAARGQPWIDDPSNRDTRFARTVLRRDPPDRAAYDSLLQQAARAGAARAALDAAAARLCAEHVSLLPDGVALVDAGLMTADSKAAEEALTRTLMTVGGADWPPDAGQAGTFARDLISGAEGRAHSLAGCLLIRHGAGLVVCREAARAAPPAAVLAGETLVWDRRVQVTAGARAAGCEIGPLGDDSVPEAVRQPLPRAACASLPAVRRSGQIHAVLGRGDAEFSETLRFSPNTPLSAPVFRPAGGAMAGQGATLLDGAPGIV